MSTLGLPLTKCAPFTSKMLSFYSYGINVSWYFSILFYFRSILFYSKHAPSSLDIHISCHLLSFKYHRESNLVNSQIISESFLINHSNFFSLKTINRIPFRTSPLFISTFFPLMRTVDPSAVTLVSPYLIVNV